MKFYSRSMFSVSFIFGLLLITIFNGILSVLIMPTTIWEKILYLAYCCISGFVVGIGLGKLNSKFAKERN